MKSNTAVVAGAACCVAAVAAASVFFAWGGISMSLFFCVVISAALGSVTDGGLSLDELRRDDSTMVVNFHLVCTRYPLVTDVCCCGLIRRCAWPLFLLLTLM